MISAATSMNPLSAQSRYEQGLAVLSAVDGEAGHRVVESLSDIAPDLAEHIVSYGFGDVYARPGLVPAQRQLVTLGMLTALGGCEPQLTVHVNAALNVGLSPTEIVEAIIHSAVYCGFPKALNAIFVVKQVFADRGISLSQEPPDVEDPTILDPEHHRVLLTNDHVTVRHINYGPHESSVMHDYDDCVVLWLTDGQLSFELPDGTVEQTEGNAHDVRWIPAGRHRPHNLSSQPFAAIAVDLKQPHTR